MCSGVADGWVVVRTAPRGKLNVTTGPSLSYILVFINYSLGFQLVFFVHFSKVFGVFSSDSGF